MPDPVTAGSPFGGIIYTYTRAQALADGALVAAADEIREEAGFKHPVAFTAAAWADVVAWDEHDGDRTGHLQDEDGRLWDVFTMLRWAIRRSTGPADRAHFEVLRIARDARPGDEATPARLVAVCGPGDDAEPVITISLPGED